MTEETDDIELFKKYVYWTEEEVKCYNAAIDKAIEIVKGYFGYPANSDDPHAKPLISKLQALKK